MAEYGMNTETDKIGGSGIRKWNIKTGFWGDWDTSTVKPEYYNTVYMEPDYVPGQNVQSRTGSASLGGNFSGGLSGQYAAAGQSYSAAMEAAYQAQKAQLEKQAQELARQYEGLRTQSYVNGRLGSIGNNEMLAAKGLAGNLYQGTQSGVSETSRVAQDIAMRNNINLASTQEQAAKDDIAAQILQAGYTKDIQVAQYMADLAIQQAQAEAQLAAQQLQAQMQAQSLALEQSRWQQEFDASQNQWNAQWGAQQKADELDYYYKSLQAQQLYNQINGSSRSSSRRYSPGSYIGNGLNTTELDRIANNIFDNASASADLYKYIDNMNRTQEEKNYLKAAIQDINMASR